MAVSRRNMTLVFSSLAIALVIALPLSSASVSFAMIPEEPRQGAHAVLLSEGFDSWSEIDPDWTFQNCTTGDFRNWFDISDGRLHATNNGMMELMYYLSYANWTHDIEYQGEFRMSFDIYLPLGYTDKIGWAGQVFWCTLFDQSDNYGLISRFVMDATGANPSPNGFVYWDSDGVIQQICTFEAGWHHVVYILRQDSMTWSVVFDGVLYEGLQYSMSETGPFDISKLCIMNALREEVQNVYMDNLIIEVFDKGQGKHGLPLL